MLNYIYIIYFFFRNLSKLYDSIEKLHFKMEGGQKSKLAIAMEEKNGEKVNFSKPCDCNGQVHALF